MTVSNVTSTPRCGAALAHGRRRPGGAPVLATFVGLSLAGVLLAGCSLAGDVTPPPGMDTGVRPSAPLAAAPGGSIQTVSADSFPSAAPSVVQGAEVYAAHCAACHGPTGHGDGEKSAQLMTQRTEPIPDFSTPERLNPRTPGELYQTVTQGNLDKFMPPFGDTLTDAERWSAIAFLYTLSAPQTTLDAGQALYSTQCANCHGPNADPAQAASDPAPTDFTDPAYMAGHSQAQLLAGLNPHTPPLEPGLSPDEGQAVVAHLRMLSFSTAATSAAETNVTAPEAASAGAVHGRVSNGTQGASLPAGLSVVLHGYDDFNQALMLTTTVDASGAFEFVDVPAVAGRQFMLTVDHAGLAYGSDIFNFDSGLDVSGLALTIFDGTPDAAQVRIDRLHLVVTQSAAGGPFTVTELVLFSNLGERTVVSPDGPVVTVPLPAGATAVAVQDLAEGRDYVRTADGVGLLLPVRPGPSAAQLTLTFQLPAGSSLEFSQRAQHPVQSLDVVVGETLTLQGGALQDGGLQSLQAGTVHVYTGGDIAAEGTIAFRLDATTGAVSVPAVDGSLLAAGGVLVVAGAGAGGFWWWRRRSLPVEDEADDDETDDVETLLQAIADLDDAFDAGRLQPNDYRAERARLKAQLVALSGASTTRA